MQHIFPSISPQHRSFLSHSSFLSFSFSHQDQDFISDGAYVSHNGYKLVPNDAPSSTCRVLLWAQHKTNSALTIVRVRLSRCQASCLTAVVSSSKKERATSFIINNQDARMKYSQLEPRDTIRCVILKTATFDHHREGRTLRKGRSALLCSHTTCPHRQSLARILLKRRKFTRGLHSEGNPASYWIGLGSETQAFSAAKRITTSSTAIIPTKPAVFPLFLEAYKLIALIMSQQSTA